jgi:hypothetical protein
LFIGGVAATLSAVLVAGFLVPAISQQSGGREELNLCLQEGRDVGYDVDVDVNEEDFGPGDYSLFTDKLYNKETKKPAGHDVGRFTVVKTVGQRDAEFILDVTAVTPNGKISLYGTGRFSGFEKGLRLAVTGGTGRYNNATGGAVVSGARCLGKRGTKIALDLTLN